MDTLSSNLSSRGELFAIDRDAGFLVSLQLAEHLLLPNSHFLELYYVPAICNIIGLIYSSS